MSLSCNGSDVINGTYKPLSARLLDFGNEVYARSPASQRVFMWIFSFHDGANGSPSCRNGFERMYAWFNRYGLINDPVRGVRIVIENTPKDNLIYCDLGIDKLPMHIFTDSEGKVVDILYDFPDDEWLDRYILPIIKKDTSVL